MQQLVRLLESWAKLRTSGYNPCVLNFRVLTQVLVSAAPSLTDQEVSCALNKHEWKAPLASLHACCACLRIVADGLSDGQPSSIRGMVRCHEAAFVRESIGRSTSRLRTSV